MRKITILAQNKQTNKIMSEDQKQQLQSKLWDISNILRGKINADDYRDYILGFIFYKYLSEKQYLFATDILVTEEFNEYLKITDESVLSLIREESLQTLGYFLNPNELFSEICKKGTKEYILDDLNSIFRNIEQSTMGTESEDDFNALFEDIDLQSTKIGKTVGARNEVIVNILQKLDDIDFKLKEIDSDVLGDAYEYLISKFASGAGKSAGEFYTPQQVSTILSKIVTTGKQKIKSVYDPTCGSGSLLLRISNECEVNDYFGQELNRTTYNLARMNMILHDIHYRNFDIKQEDSLMKPQHMDHKFEAIVANPPFSAHWKGKDNPLYNNDERFSEYGKLAPKTKADYAFVQHMIHHLADNGVMATVLPHGVLFRGSAEGVIRKYLISELNYLDAVIGLPANIFFGTSIPTCILVFKKCRKHDDSIMFIDASGEEHFEKQKNQNVLRLQDIDLIVDTYRKRKTIDKFSYSASLDEIAENDYNLNIPRYVDTFEEEEPIDLIEVSNNLVSIREQLKKSEAQMNDYCKQLGIPTPF